MSKAEAIYDKVRSLPETAQAAVLRMVELLAPGVRDGAADAPQAPELAQRFRELADVWQRETRFLSFMEQRAMHPAYQRIVGLGWVAVPLILRELQRQPDHWLWALQAITGEQPPRQGEDFGAAVTAWLRWGRERGLLADGQG